MWGLQGVAIGVLVALGLNYVLTSHLCLHLVDMGWGDFLRAHLPAVLLSGAAVAGGLAVDTLLGPVDLPAAVVLLTDWAAGLLSCVLLVRVAWRTRLLAPLARLVTEVHGFLFGQPARVAARLLGPGYRPLLHKPAPTGTVQLPQPVDTTARGGEPT
jgi:hypothetical protein